MSKRKKMASIDAHMRFLAQAKLYEDYKLVDSLLLDRFLDIFQDLHGEEIGETVQDLYELSAEYEEKHEPQKLEELGKAPTSLDAGDIIVVTKSFSHMLNLANLAEEVQIGYHRRIKLKKEDFVDENSAITESDIEETLKCPVVQLKKSKEEVFDALKNQTVDLVLTAHPTQSVRRSLLQKHGRIRSCLTQLNAKDITPDDKQELDEALQRENVDANVVAVTKRYLTDVGPSSALVTPSLRNLQPGSSSRNGNLRNLKPEEHDRNRLYEENKPSIVFVSNVGARHDVFTLQVLEVPKGFGSGFIWDRIGHIVTNYHVIHGAINLSVTLADETQYKAKVVGYDQDNDVAVLRIDAPKEKLRPIKVGTSSNLCVCMDVCAIGHPFGFRYAWTPGVISQLGVYFPSPANGQPILGGILTNALINPGNSGGPLLDRSGYLIGIVTAIYSKISESCGVAYAVPVDTVKGIVEQFVIFGEVRGAYIR